MLQVVLLTDGLDTRPYRLNWPTSTLVFHICPEKVFRGAVQKLQGFNILLPFGVCSSPYFLVVGVWTRSLWEPMHNSQDSACPLDFYLWDSLFLFVLFLIMRLLFMSYDLLFYINYVDIRFWTCNRWSCFPKDYASYRIYSSFFLIQAGVDV